MCSLSPPSSTVCRKIRRFRRDCGIFTSSYRYGGRSHQGSSVSRGASHSGRRHHRSEPKILAVNGAYTWYMGFEVTNSDSARTNPNGHSNPPNMRAVGVSVLGPE